LNKGLLFHDEAFYLLHLRDVEVFSTSYWYLLARSIYPQDIIGIRWMTVSLLIISHLVFVTGMAVYLRNFMVIRVKQFTLLLALSLLGQFVLWMPVQFVPSYWTFNYMSILCALGFMMISYSLKNDKVNYAFSFLSGLLIGFIPFIMITNIPLILLMLITSFLHVKDKTRRHIYYYFLSFFIGIFATFVLYFTLIQSLNDFIVNFKESLKHLNYDKSHGIFPMIKWIIKSMQYLSVEILLLSIAIIFSDLFINKASNFTLKIVVDMIIFLAIIFMMLDGFLLSSETGIFSPSLFLVLFFVLLYKNVHNKIIDLKVLTLFLTFLLMPFIASLGTNVHFELRGVAYISVIFVSIYVLIVFLKDIKYKIVFTIFLFVVTVVFMRLPFISGWTFQKQIEQTHPVKSLGINQNILLDTERFNNLEKLKEIVPQNSYVLVSHRSFWGYVYLLDLKIPYLYFDFSENLFFEQFKLHPSDINNYVFIELSTIPFPDDFFERLKALGYDLSDVDKIAVNDDITVYKSKSHKTDH
jgi:hypothetical protein